MFRSVAGRGRGVAPLNASRFRLITVALAVTLATGIDCPEPCIDGPGGDRPLDTSTSVRLTNHGLADINLIGIRETPDRCNRLFQGESRLILIDSRFEFVTVRAFAGDTKIDEIVCALPEEAAVGYTEARGLFCVNTGG